MRNASSLANLRPPWTPEQARDNARKSNAAQAAKRAASPEIKPDLPPAESEDDSPDAFHSRKLVRVRRQWTALDRMIESETEPAKLDRLIAALARIEEIERRLSQRSLPATLRANGPVRPGRRLSAAGSGRKPQPIVPQGNTPQPVQVPVSAVVAPQ